MSLTVHGNDLDVDLYLKELKGIYVTILTSQETELANFKILVDNLKTSLDSQKIIENDKYNFLQQKYIETTSLISSIEAKYKNNIDIRYSTYKTDLQALVATSGFINLVNYELNNFLDSDNRELVKLRRRSNELTLLLDSSSKRIQYIDEFKSELNKMNWNV